MLQASPTISFSFSTIITPSKRNPFTMRSRSCLIIYLTEEILQRQLSHVQAFLLQTSILNRMGGELCDGLFSDPDFRLPISESSIENRKMPKENSQELLERLEQGNLFIVPLDDERTWYRYHRLFADLLRHRLQMELPDTIAELHNRASYWFAQNGFPADAIQHALAAQDWEHAIALILSECGTLLARGEIVTMRKWLQALPDALKRAQPERFIRTFADAGEALFPLLRGVALKGIFPDYVGKIMVAIKRKPSASLQSVFVEPLSEREVDVLRLMAAGLSNRAIAQKLVISLGTAKTHVHNIFGKLDASNRVQAVDRARELRIV